MRASPLIFTTNAKNTPCSTPLPGHPSSTPSHSKLTHPPRRFLFAAAAAGSGRWDEVSRHFSNRSPTQCARKWALGGTRAAAPSPYPSASSSDHSRHNSGGSLTPASTGGGGSAAGGGSGPGAAAGAGSPAGAGVGVSYRWGVPVAEHHHHHHHNRSPSSSMAPSDGTALGAAVAAAAAAAAAAATAATAPTSEGPVSRGVLQQRVGGGYPSSGGRSSASSTPQGKSGGVLPFGSPGGGGAGSTGRGPKGVGSWTKEEDERLNALVGMFGVKWSQVRGGRLPMRLSIDLLGVFNGRSRPFQLGGDPFRYVCRGRCRSCQTRKSGDALLLAPP